MQPSHEEVHISGRQALIAAARRLGVARWSFRVAAGMVRSVLVGFLVAGCAGLKPTPPAPRVSPEPLVREVIQRRAQLQSLRAAGSIRVRSRWQRWSGRFFFLGSNTDRLRLELFSSLGQPVLYLVSRGEGFTSWSPGSKRAWFGRDHGGKSLRLLLDLPVDDSEAFYLLAGIPPMLTTAAASAPNSGTEPEIILVNKATGGQERWWRLDSEGRLLELRHRLAKDKTLAVSYRYPPGGGVLPVALELESAEFHLAVTYSKLEANVILDEAVFDLSLPPGIQVLPWGKRHRDSSP